MKIEIEDNKYEYSCDECNSTPDTKILTVSLNNFYWNFNVCDDCRKELIKQLLVFDKCKIYLK